MEWPAFQLQKNLSSNLGHMYTQCGVLFAVNTRTNLPFSGGGSKLTVCARAAV